MIWKSYPNSSIPIDDKIIPPKFYLKGVLAIISKDETVKAVFRNETDSLITLNGGHKFCIGMKVYNLQTDHDDSAVDFKSHNDKVFVNVCQCRKSV